MNDPNVTRSGTPYVPSAGSVMRTLQVYLDRTPRYAAFAAPLPRALLRRTLSELERLQAENAALMAQLNGHEPTGG